MTYKFYWKEFQAYDGESTSSVNKNTASADNEHVQSASEQKER